MAVSITICNLALGELRAPAIADIGEDSIEARECARYYPQCLKLLLERFAWSFATKTATLAALSVNARVDEWLYAYALPADFANVTRLVGQSTFSTRDWDRMRSADPYLVEAGVLYGHTPGAVLEYTTNDLPETAMSSLFVDALAFALAARLAVPIRDSRELKGELLKQAEIATQRAIADDDNRQPQRYDVLSDEVTDARRGWSC